MMRLFFYVTFLPALLFSSKSFAFDDLSSAKLKDVPSIFKDADVIEVGYLSPFLKQGLVRKRFPINSVYPFDPINEKHYEKAIAGETYQAGIFSSYTHWRYVTVYDVKEIMEPIAYLPYYEEECYDDSFRLASWGESRSLKVSLRSEIAAKVGVEGMGLSSSISTTLEKGITFSTSRSIKATLGLKARHYPYKRSETWTGKTWIETYNTNTGAVGYLLPSVIQDLMDSYPYDFELDNQKVGFVVQREVIEYCESMNSDEGSSIPSKEVLIH